MYDDIAQEYRLASWRAMVVKSLLASLFVDLLPFVHHTRELLTKPEVIPSAAI